MDKTILDIDDVLERVQDDWELLLELLDIFSGDYEEKKKLLEQQISGGDFEQIRNIAHSLKGAAGNISAAGFHQIFWEMEQAAVNKDMTAIQKQFAKLDEQYPALQQCMNQIKEDYKKNQQ